MILFDIIVPTYNRYEELPLFFKKNEELAGSPIAHFWIVDDCSTSYQPAVVPAWTNITFIRLEKNGGQTFARNVAIDSGSAPYVISLDDDAWLENGPQDLDLLDKAFNQYPDTGCFMFNIATPETDYSVTETGKELPLHVTCGCAYRRETLKRLGGFSAFLHSGAEETDISLRILMEGWKIRFVKEVRVFHNFVPYGRGLSWLYSVRYNTTRNDLLIVFMHYPLVYVPFFIAGKYISHILFAIKYKVSAAKTLYYTMIALLGFLKHLPEACRRRRALTIRQFHYWRSL